MTTQPSSQTEIVAAIWRVYERCDAAGVSRPRCILGKGNAAWWRKHAADKLKAGIENGSVYLLQDADFVDAPAQPDLFGAAA